MAISLALPAAAPPIAPSCPEFPPLNLPGVLCEGFDTDRNGIPGFQWSRLPLGPDLADPLRALGDPDDDVLGYTISGVTSPLGTAGVICSDDNLGYVGCQAPVAEENDWHLHSPFEGPGEGYTVPGRPDLGQTEGGKAHGGFRSMHMGRHLQPLNLYDTLRLRQVSAFVLDSHGDPDVPGLAIGPASTMSFWHIISVPDDENFGNGFLPQGTTFAGGQVQVSLLGDDGLFERWQPVTPTFNGYDSRIQETVSLCGFDPGDDALAPADETMCDNSPMYADKGDVFGSDVTCLTDTDFNDTRHKDCGDISCTPGPGCTENGSLGPGVWTRSEFDLSAFAGRVARLRWIGMVEGGWSFATYRSAMEPDPGLGTTYPYFLDSEDGWWIDDIVVTDLRQSPCADEDGDGFTGCDGDCDDGSALVSPDAAELPGDHRDENCDGELSCDPFASWKNRGQFVHCVSQACESLVDGGFVTAEECEQIVSRAARIRFVAPPPEPSTTPQENPGPVPSDPLPEPW